MIIKNKNVFHLQGKNISYIMAVNECGDLLHYYYGKKLRDKNYEWIKQKWSVWNGYGPDKWTLDICPQEYPAYGYTDLRTPAYSIVNRQGGSVSRLTYKTHKIIQNATQEIDGMPNLFMGDKHAQTLEITLEDKNAGFEAILSYTVFDEYDIIVRSTKIVNTSNVEITIDSAYSAALDISKDNYELIHFSGGWAKEREMYRSEIRQGVKIDISNARGGSGHNINPFVMLAKSGADEMSGEVYSMTLVYSGNHSTMLECDQFGNIRLMQGINPFGFEWKLKEGESFQTPQSVMCYSDKGIGGISRELHDVIRQNLCRSKWVNKERPILINNWEATYMDFNEEKLLNIAKTAKEQGVELFVLDDGWFGDRYDEETSMGDWSVNLKKIPSGIDGLAQKINDLGLKFGLWFEPESVNPKSNLYRMHKDWIVRYPGIEPTESRFEYLLDLTLDEVCEYAINSVCDILSSANIEYVKWDMNRSMADVYASNVTYDYVVGVYDFLEKLTSKYPNILIEGCSGGGGRFDAGMLYYTPQIWCSDNTDAINRTRIQYGTSFFYPVAAMGSHVSAVPNHQTGRVTSLHTRGVAAMSGTFGYELNPALLSVEEKAEIRMQLAKYREHQELIREGNYYRLSDPFQDDFAAWMVVSEDQNQALVSVVRLTAEANPVAAYVTPRGLAEDAFYLEKTTGKVYAGAALMEAGILLTAPKGEYEAYQIMLQRVTE